MSLHLPARRAAANAARASLVAAPIRLQYAVSISLSIPAQSASLLPREQRRNAWFSWGKKKKANEASTPLAKELTKREKEQQLAEKLSTPTQGASIFDEEIKTAEDKEQELDKLAKDAPRRKRQVYTYSRVKEHMERALNPDPRWRVRFHRKKIMQMVRKGGQLTREERIKASERELTSKSEVLPTSTKKLMHLARQIAGKTVDDAITQMRYSPKKMAREVRFQLEEARDMAIASRGMGLGPQSGQAQPKKRLIKTKDGKTLEVEDPTRLYVDESWVTKGPWRHMRIQYHARGRMSQMWSPTTRINVVLKEEKTRIRLHDERVAKEAKKAPWVHLPNRPVTAQRPYYSW
ncbi:ribosomal protein L22/L17 [Nemania sp. FL0916]|nr:ribosomal protein L22/L17 [Nemania sp. FL0916]